MEDKKEQAILDIEDRIMFLLLESRKFRHTHKLNSQGQKKYYHLLCDKIGDYADQYRNVTGQIYTLK